METESSDRECRDKKVPIYKLFWFADSLDFGLMTVGSLAAIANGLTTPLLTIILGRIINSFGFSSGVSILHNVSQICLEFVYLGIGTGVASFLQVSCWMMTGERQASRIRSLYLKAMLRQDISFFDKETTTGEIIGRMTGDTVLIQDAMGEKVGKLLQMMSNFFGGFALAFLKGWHLAIVLLPCIPTIVIVGVLTSLSMAKVVSRGQKAYAKAGNVVEQTVGSIRTVVSFTGENKAITKYNNSIKTAYRCTVQQGLVSGVGVGCTMLIIFLSYGLGVWYGSKMIIEKGYSGGHVINVMMAVMNCGMSLARAFPSINALSTGTAAAYKIFETIDRKPEIDAYDMSGMVLEYIHGDIELRDVHFRYPARPDVQVFSGFSIQMPRGTTTALVGESGSGKSTVISLIERFYDPEAGEVLVDGIDLKKFRVGWIREQIGLVGQEPVLFMASIQENIAYGKNSATLEEIRKAIELSNAATFIDKLPQGLQTMISGTQLSGGQKQRLAIARAILKNPKILLLDEATSALDVESERVVQDALMRVMVNRTTMVVAHRLSIVRDADNIVVVHRGKIVEQGLHSELIKDPEGSYSQLISLQARKGELEEASKLVVEKADQSIEASSLNISGSKRLSMRRSVSRGSPVGGSGRFSFSLSFGDLPTPIAIHGDGQEGIGEDGIGHVDKQHKLPFTRLAYLNKPELPVIILGIISAVAHGVLFPVIGVLLSSAIKIFYEPAQQLRKDSRFWSMMFVCFGGVALVSISFQQSMFGIAGAKLVNRIRHLTFERVVHQEISWFDEPNNSSGAIGARLSTDASIVRTLVGDALALIVQNIATITTGVLIAMITNWKLALIILVLVPLLGIQGFAQERFMKGFTADAKVMYEEASQVANEALSNIRTVASFCAEQKVIDLYEKKCEVPKKNGVRQGIISGTGFGFSNLMMFCTYALCSYAGARFVQHGYATFQQVFRVFYALSMTALGVSQSNALVPDATKAKESAASIFAILDRKSKIDSSKDEGMIMPTVKGDIEFEHVSFRYPTRPDVQIFKDLCLSIRSGKTVALVGESGSGKSTIIALLERFYDPNHGRILLDGIEIQKFKLNWLRQQMGLVSQEPILFNDTIGANIAYCREGAISEDEIIAAAKALNVHDFISGLPDGYNTNVGEKGVQLSGGQKQRIAIARVMLKDPRILLLDEATSALDVESERVVQKALDNAMVNRTTVVVAHRLSTIKRADNIVVVKNGVIVEKGRHEVLMEITNGAYASLVALHMSSSS